MPKSKMPNKIVIIPNLDKEWHELPDRNNMAHMAHPSRNIACGPPNSGKTLLLKKYLTSYIYTI